MSTTLVVGASRGLGRGFVQQLLARGEQVIATVRKSEDAAALQMHALETGTTEQFETLRLDVAGQYAVHPAAVPQQQHLRSGMEDRFPYLHAVGPLAH